MINSECDILFWRQLVNEMPYQELEKNLIHLNSTIDDTTEIIYSQAKKSNCATDSHSAEFTFLGWLV